MRLSTISSMAILWALLGCNTQPVEYTPQSNAATAEKVDNQKIGASEKDNETPVVEDETEADEKEEVEDTPVEENLTPLTQADLLAMDEVVITATLDGTNATATYRSDIGRTQVTTSANLVAQETVAAGEQPKTTTLLNAATPLQVKEGQKLIFCVSPNSIGQDQREGTLRIHSSDSVAFGHWPGGAVLSAGQCSGDLGEGVLGDETQVVQMNTSGNPTDTGMYNHNSNEGNTRINFQVVK